MNEAQKQALIKKLVADNNKAFDARYSGENRKWFVGKIIDYLLPQAPPADLDFLEMRTNNIIAEATDAVNRRKERQIPPDSLKDKFAAINQLTSRTQIIYGMIALHPQFLDAAFAGYFDFILERRFRSIQRMAFYVNPNNERKIFGYPKKNEQMKLNKAAADFFWVGVQGTTPPLTLPFVLKSEGRSDPKAAVEILFMPNKTESDRNLLACDPVATILHMDALLFAAKNPKTLLKALADIGDHYLKIDNPNGHFANNSEGQRLVAVTSAPVAKGTHVDIAVGKIGPILVGIQATLTPDMLTNDNYILFPGLLFMILQEDVHESFVIDLVNPMTRVIRVGTLKNNYDAGAKIYVTKVSRPFYSTLPYHFITDSRRDHALFEQVTVKSADLQVGDHAYVINHPLYKIFYPSGPWGGEHSFISEIDSRDSTASGFRNALKLGGHGVPNRTLLSMADEMLKYNNTVLGILQALTPIHLGNLKKNKRPSADKAFVTTVDGIEFDVAFHKRNEGGIDMNVFEYDGPYTYFVVIRGKKKSFKMTNGFVIKERVSDADKAFQVFDSDSTDSVTPPEAFLEVAFTGTGPAEQFMLSKWGLKYFNAQTTRLEFQRLFDEKDNKTPKQMTFDDLAKSNPFYITDDNGDAFITRPRVDFRAPYQTFLKSNGAFD